MDCETFDVLGRWEIEAGYEQVDHELYRLRARRITFWTRFMRTNAKLNRKSQPGPPRRVKPRAVVRAICASAPLCRHAVQSTPWDGLRATQALLPVQRRDPDGQ